MCPALQDAEVGLKTALSSAGNKDEAVQQMEAQLQQHRCCTPVCTLQWRDGSIACLPKNEKADLQSQI